MSPESHKLAAESLMEHVAKQNPNDMYYNPEAINVMLKRAEIHAALAKIPEKTDYEMLLVKYVSHILTINNHLFKWQPDDVEPELRLTDKDWTVIQTMVLDSLKEN